MAFMKCDLSLRFTQCVLFVWPFETNSGVCKASDVQPSLCGVGNTPLEESSAAEFTKLRVERDTFKEKEGKKD